MALFSAVRKPILISFLNQLSILSPWLPSPSSFLASFVFIIACLVSGFSVGHRRPPKEKSDGHNYSESYTVGILAHHEPARSGRGYFVDSQGFFSADVTLHGALVCCLRSSQLSERFFG